MDQSDNFLDKNLRYICKFKIRGSKLRTYQTLVTRETCNLFFPQANYHVGRVSTLMCHVMLVFISDKSLFVECDKEDPPPNTHTQKKWTVLYAQLKLSRKQEIVEN